MKSFLETGKIVGTHGIRGEIKVESWADSPELLKEIPCLYFDEGETMIPIKSRRLHKNLMLMTVKGIESVEEAEKLRGRLVYLSREDIELEEGVYFIQDLIGLSVIDDGSGRLYGKISNVLSTGANDVYEIRGDSGETYLFPAVAHMIAGTSLSEGWVRVKPIPGIFDDGGISDAD